MIDHDDAPGRGQFGPDRVNAAALPPRDVLLEGATARALQAADDYLGQAHVDVPHLVEHSYLDLVEEVLAEVRRRLAPTSDEDSTVVAGGVHGMSFGRPDLGDLNNWIRDGHVYVEVRLDGGSPLPALGERVRVTYLDREVSGR
jgi:hypothetical protein